MFEDYLSFSYAHGLPTIKGGLKQTPADFYVEEVLPFTPNGEGEHFYLWIEKEGCNTKDVAVALAEQLGCKQSVVSYAGLKDKHAITRQWFSLHLPGTTSISISDGEGWRVCDITKNQKKLKIGALKGNRFVIVLRDLEGELETIDDTLKQIQQNGVPNYFMEQRFGHLGHNLIKAHRLLCERQKVKSRFLRGMYISAMRSYLFNKHLSARVDSGTWQTAMVGDVMQLTGSSSVFIVESPKEDSIDVRIASGDISPALMLPGAGNMLQAAEALAFESEVLRDYSLYLDALHDLAVERAYRASIATPENMQWNWQKKNMLALSFYLESGSYATAVIRELMQKKRT